MKRLVLAAALAMSLHGVLFYGGWDPLGKGKTADLKPRQITLSLSYLPPLPKTPPLPLEKKAPIIEKVPHKKKMPEKPPKQAKRLVSPVRPAKEAPKKPEPVMKSEPPSTPPIEQAPLPPAEVALPTSVMEEPAPALQAVDEEKPSSEAGEILDRQEPAPVLTLAIPLYKENPAPKYPRIAKKKGYEGKVLLDVLVNQEGKVESVAISQSSGHAVLDEAAIKAVASWLFSPATRGTERVTMWIKVPIRFDLR